jgi:hypothetical protein
MALTFLIVCSKRLLLINEFTAKVCQPSLNVALGDDDHDSFVIPHGRYVLRAAGSIQFANTNFDLLLVRVNHSNKPVPKMITRATICPQFDWEPFPNRLLSAPSPTRGLSINAEQNKRAADLRTG